MKKIDANQQLLEKIKQAEINCDLNLILLKEQVKRTGECLQPINLIKSAFASTELKNTIVDNSIGIASGILVKKAVVRSSNNPLLKLVGSILQIGVANLVTKNPEAIKSVGKSIIKKIFNKKEVGKDEDNSENV